MEDWNVVVTIYQELGAARRTRGILRQLGEVATTEFHNVLVMRVANIDAFLREFSAIVAAEPGILNDISRVTPLASTFNFLTHEEFEEKARVVAMSFLPQLHNRSFYVRLHRRGLRSLLQSPKEERFLDEALLAALEDAGAPGHVRFEDPDVVIDIETAGNRAGMSLWSREDLERCPFLKVD